MKKAKNAVGRAGFKKKSPQKNMKNIKKRGFTIVELMAVISIIAVLIIILVPTITGYVNRSKKLNIVIQARNAIEYAVSVGISPENNIKLIDLKNNNVFIDYVRSLDCLQDDIQYSTLRSISRDQEAVNKIKIENGKIIEWTGENPYKKK